MAGISVQTFLDVTMYNGQGQQSNVTYYDDPLIVINAIPQYLNPECGPCWVNCNAKIKYTTTCPDGYVDVYGPLFSNYALNDTLVSAHGPGRYYVKIDWDGKIEYQIGDCLSCVGVPFTTTVSIDVLTRMVDIVWKGYSYADGSITSSPQIMKNPTHPNEVNALNTYVWDASGLVVDSAVVKVQIDSTLIGTYVAVNGVVDVSFLSPAVGTHQVVLIYDGDAGHNPGQLSIPLVVEPGIPVKQNTYIVCYPNASERLVDFGSTANIGCGVLISGSNLLPSYPCLVKVYITRPGENEFLYKTVNSQSQWFESYLPSKTGRWTIRYVFDGNDAYNSSTCSSYWDVAQCNEPIYEDCLDGSQVMTYDCQDGYLVATGDVCVTPTYPTIMAACSATPVDQNGLILPWGKVGGKVILDSGPVTKLDLMTYLSVPIKTEVKLPGSFTWVKVADSGHFEYYPPVEGIYSVRFVSESAVISGAIYQATSCNDTFEVKSCYDGSFADPYTCSDGSTIYLSVCQNGGWVPTNNTCDTPVDQCTIDHPVHPRCIDGEVWDCVDGIWQNKGIPCENPTPDNKLLLLGVGLVAAVGAVAVMMKPRRK